MRPNSHNGAPHTIDRARFGATIALFAIALILARTSAACAAQQNPADIVALQSTQLETPLTAGHSSVAVVTARIADGWHINSNRPLGDYAIPTRVEVTSPAATTVGAIVYPEAHLVTLAFAGTEKLSVYSGTVQFRIPFSASAAFRNGVGAPAKIELHFQACNDSQCLRPVSIGTTIDLSAISTTSAATDSNGTGGASSTVT